VGRALRVSFVPLLLGALLFASPLGAAVPYPGFHTPSKNIYCAYNPPFGRSGATIRCDIFSGLRPEPRRGCELDWTGLSLSPTGRGQPVCAGDTVADRRLRVLAYGSKWRHRGFTCASRRTGLTCRNARGHGFFLSRAGWRVF
jgi:hypothetical protein